jgi:hypothetical protein
MNTKFTLSFLAALTIAVVSNAQINKGSIALGGNINFNSERSKYDNGFKETTISFLISPSLMISYNNNKAMGFSLTYNHARYSVLDQKSNTYGAGVFLRQYKPLGKGFYIFAQEALNFMYSKSNSLNDTVLVENKTSSVMLTANPGLAYDLSKKVQLELLLFNNFLSAGYSHHTLKGTNLSTIKSDDFSIGANLDASQLTSLNIGAKIFFGR